MHPSVCPIFLKKYSKEYNFCSSFKTCELQFVTLPQHLALEHVSNQMTLEIAKFVLAQLLEIGSEVESNFDFFPKLRMNDIFWVTQDSLNSQLDDIQILMDGKLIKHPELYKTSNLNLRRLLNFKACPLTLRVTNPYFYEKYSELMAHVSSFSNPTYEL